MSRRVLWLALGVVVLGVIGAGVLFGPRVFERLELQFGAPPVCDPAPAGLPVGGVWSAGQTGPNVRAAAGFVTLDEQIYQAGGFIAGWQPVAVFDRYDPATNSWQTLAPLPAARHRPGIAALDGKIYVTGGFDAPIFWDPTATTAWVYDPQMDSWSDFAPLPSARAAHYMAAVGGRLIAVGGQGPDALAVWIYDPATDAWETAGALLPVPPRDNMTGVVYQDRIYLFGGRWVEKDNFGFVVVYDPATDTWEQRADMPIPRSTATGVVVGEQIHLIGGQQIDLGCTFGAHEIYDPASDSWTRLVDMPTPRHSVGAALIGDRIYVVAGATGAGPRMQYHLSGVVEMLTLEG